MDIRSSLESTLALAATSLISLTLVFVVSSAAAQDTPLYLFGGQGHEEFLGCLNCGEHDPKSVWNSMSRFGFENDFGVWNSFG